MGLKRKMFPAGMGYTATPESTRQFSIGTTQPGIPAWDNGNFYPVSLRHCGQDLLKACKDDGEENPDRMKEKIFWRGVGKNYGSSFFFAREIRLT